MIRIEGFDFQLLTEEFNMFLQYAIQCFTTEQTVECNAVVVGYFIKTLVIITMLFNFHS